MTTAVPTVFIVENDVAVGDSMRALLESAGFRAEVHRSGEAFADTFDSGRSGCLVLDVDPQSTSPVDFLDRLAARDIELPVILISWFIDADLGTLAKREGVAAVLEKPLSVALFLSEIERALAKA